MSDTYEQEIETFIGDVFEQNFEQLYLESGTGIAPDVKETALQQVLLYWRVLREVAEHVTDTEVRLSLPNQESPAGRDYTIEGIVDIIRENDRTIMYDIKTHDADYVRTNREIYEQQLNIYAYIWQQLRKQDLDEIAVIATNYPDEVKSALDSGDEQAITFSLSQWEPLIPIGFDLKRVDDTIREFGMVVDAIEDSQFAPPPIETLQQTFIGSGNVRFGTRVCRNCDARFSCSSYRQYARQSGGRVEQNFRRFFSDLVAGSDDEDWRTANLDATPNTDDLRNDFGA